MRFVVVLLSQDPSNVVTALGTSLLSAFTDGFQVSNEFGSQTINSNFGAGSLIGTPGFPVENGDAPMAFLNLMFLPDRESITLENGVTFAFDQVDVNATQPIGLTTKNPFDSLKIEDFEVPQTGYVMVYLSNESATLVDVHFDDLKITLNQTPVIQTDDHYPFGLSMAENTYDRDNPFYQGQVTTSGFGLKDLGFRQYDPVLGRFHSIDPLGEIQYSQSPFQYAGNDPVGSIDVLGLSIFSRVGDFFKRLVGRGPSTITKQKNGKKVKKVVIAQNTRKVKPVKIRKRPSSRTQSESRSTTQAKKKPSDDPRFAHLNKRKHESEEKTDFESFFEDKGGDGDEESVFGPPLLQRDRKSAPGAPNSYSPNPNDGFDSDDYAQKPDEDKNGYLDEYIEDIRESKNDAESRKLLAGLPADIGWKIYWRDQLRRTSPLALNFKTRISQVLDNPTNESTEPDSDSPNPLVSLNVVLIRDGKLLDKVNVIFLPNGSVSETSGFDGFEVKGDIDFRFKIESKNGVYEVDFENLDPSDEYKSLEPLLLEAKEYAQQFLKPSYPNLGEAQKGVNIAFNKTRDYLEAHSDSDEEVTDFVGIPDQLAGVKESVAKFKEKQGVDSKVTVADRELFDKLKEDYESGKLIPKKDVEVLITPNPDGSFDKHIAYKDGFYKLPTEKTLEDGSVVQLEGTMEEFEEVRDKFIDTAIEYDETQVYDENGNPVESENEQLHVFDENGNRKTLDSKKEPVLNIFEKAMWVIKTSKDLLDEVGIADKRWNEDSGEENTWPEYVPDPAAGIGNAALDEVKSIPEMVSFGLSMFDKQVRHDLVESITKINWDTFKNIYLSKADQYEATPVYAGSYDAATVVIAVLTGGKKVFDELKGLLKKSGKLGDVDWDFIRSRNLPDDQAEKLAKDLAGSDELVEVFSKNPELADAWKVADDLGVDEAIRKNVDDLNLLGKHLDDSGGDVAKLKSDFDAAPDKRKFLDDLFDDKVNEVLGDFYSGNPDDLLTEMVEDALLSGDKSKLSDLLDIKPKNKNNFLGRSGKSYDQTYSNIFDGEINGDFPDFKNVKYFNEVDRVPFEVKVKDGNLFTDGDLLSGKNDLIYVMSKDGKVYSGTQKVGEIHHSSFLAGGDVASAGEISFSNGKIILSAKSGHYVPDINSLKQVAEELVTRGVDIRKIVIDRGL